MRFRPANIRVINRRDSRLGHRRWYASWNSITDPAGCAGPLLRGACSPAWTSRRDEEKKIEPNKLT